MSKNAVTLTATQIAAGMFKFSASLEMVTDLPANQFEPYNQNLQFAGLSKRSKLLCTTQPGSPNINGVPVLPTKPTDWITFTHSILTKTRTPRLAIVPERYWREFCIHPEDLIPRFSVESSNNADKNTTEQYLAVEVQHVPRLYTQYPELRVLTKGGTLMVAIPKDTQLASQDWELLQRVIYTGTGTATYQDTAQVSDHNAMWFEGKHIQAIEEKWGITGKPDYGVALPASKPRFGYTRFRVQDAQKAAVAYPFLAFPKQVTISWYEPGAYDLPMAEVLDNPHLCKHLPANWTVNSDGTALKFKPTTDLVKFIEKPILSHLQGGGPVKQYAFITPRLLADFFIPLRKATRVRKLTPNDYIQVLTTDRVQPGNFIHKQQFEKAETRDVRAETLELKNRENRLLETVAKLPSNWKEFKDEQIIEYARLQKAVEDGTLIPAQQSVMLPHKESSAYHTMIRWLQEQGKVWECPVTHTDYVPNYASIDELTEMPGFIPALYEALGDRNLLLRLFTSDKVRGAALIESI